MSLKLKLILGFLAVLMLTLFVGFWGLRGMNTMEHNTILGDTVSEGASHLQSAQTGQMQYVLNGGENYVKATKDYLKESKEHFQEAMALLPAGNPHRQELAGLTSNVDALLVSFDELLKLTADLAKVDADYTTQGRKVVATLNELVDQAYNRQSQELSLDSAKTVRLLTDARARLYEVRWSTWLISTDPKQENLDIVLQGLERFVQSLKMAEGTLTQEASREIMRRLLDEVNIYRNFVTQSGTMTAQRAQIVRESGVLAADAVHKAESVGQTIGKETSAAQRSIALQLIAVVGLAILVGLALALLITRNVLGQLGRDPGVLAAMAQKVGAGDYNIDDGRPRHGVYGHFVSMVQALRENMEKAQAESEHARAATEEARKAARQAEAAKLEAQNARREGMLAAAVRLEEVVAVMSSASEQLSSQIDHSRQGAELQAGRVTETAAAMEEMNATVLEVAKNAGNASDVSTSTRAKAQAGAAVVRQAVESIQQVQTQSLQLKNDMNRLDENAQAINHVMTVISDIADQTNLLALNAAIEAARAGEAGRGFAVVADEVRNLAEKTMTSTSDVANAILAIQQSAAQSREQVDKAVATIDQATQFARQSGDALKEIVDLADHTADQVRAIATASEEQSASSEEISRSIAEVDAIAAQTSQAMSEATQAVSELADQAQVLSGLIDDMKRS